MILRFPLNSISLIWKLLKFLCLCYGIWSFTECVKSKTQSFRIKIGYRWTLSAIVLRSYTMWNNYCRHFVKIESKPFYRFSSFIKFTKTRYNMLFPTRFINYLHYIIIGKLWKTDDFLLSRVTRDVPPIAVQVN